MASIEDPTVKVSSENFLAFFGLNSASLPRVTTDRALTVTPVNAAVAFLSRTLAALPLHAYRDTKDGAVRVTGKLQVVVNEAAHDGMSAYAFRQYFWQQVFTGGRGLAWIERTPQGVEAIWPLDPTRTTIRREGFANIYRYGGRDYPSADVIDVPYMLKPNLVGHYGPINLAAQAIQLALAMNDYASGFFAGGGVPPLALVGPLPTGSAAIQRAKEDIQRSIDAAKVGNSPILPIPPGYELKPVGFDPEKGQMTEARRFQTEEIARAYQLPPVFLQDLSRATFTNAEQQDLHLVKHLISQWAKALETEMTLKLFGRGRGNRYVRHNLDGLLRGDFKSRIEGITRGIQTALLTPNEGRALDERPKHSNPLADELLVQGATVPLGSSSVGATNPKPEGEADEPGAPVDDGNA